MFVTMGLSFHTANNTLQYFDIEQAQKKILPFVTQFPALKGLIKNTIGQIAFNSKPG